MIGSLTATQHRIVSGLDPFFQPFVLAHRDQMLAAGIPWDITDGFRSTEEQARLFAEKPNLAAPPGRSKHEVGFAVDISGPRTPGEWTIAGELAERMGLRWGGRFRTQEPWHIEAPQPRSLLLLVHNLDSVAAGLLLTVAILFRRR